ncbi:MAG TPA: TVP38/TMEM64 family protein, partial [Candidatus Nanoarchaeia archaeon]|nr:TVP38/TMEM64 family protein [Candidatus Nanoarchaeia archaeon]
AVLAIIIFIILLANYYLPDFRNFASPSFVREYLLELGNWGYLVYVILFLLSIPLPIPSTPVAIAGGYVFGIIVGTALTILAALIGASIAFYLIRYYGEPLLEKVVSKHHIEHFMHIFKKRGINGAILAYAIPVFPSDSINFMLGLSKIRYHTFLLVVIIGSLPRYVLITSFGQELLTGFTWKTIIVPILVAVYLLTAIFREKIKRVIFKELRELEKEAKVIEKDVEKDVKWVEEEVGMKKKIKKEKSSKRK